MPSTRLALRAYGHQSPTQQKDCQDTAMLVGFAPVAANRAEVVAQAQALQARGYTPITYALTAAAQDIAPEESGERVVVLVSDGQETCASDPCIAARALAAADAKLVIHTIGFGVGAPRARSCSASPTWRAAATSTPTARRTLHRRSARRRVTKAAAQTPAPAPPCASSRARRRAAS